jgi:hypothetical protein
MKLKVITGITCTLLLVSMLTLASTISSASAIEEKTTPEVLRMAVTENITVLKNGTAQLTILTNVPSSPLAEAYRELLTAPPDAEVEEEMPIPENNTEQIYKSLVKEQRLSLGLMTEVSESKMVPRGMENECRVSIVAHASFEIVNVTRIDSDEIWQITLGAVNATSIASFVLTKVMFTKQMLESLPQEQMYENLWRTMIRLPENATLLNADELVRLNWTIDFGGGTYINASVSLDETSTIIVVDEKVGVTEQNITATPQDFYETLSTYKIFRIRYLLPSSISEHLENEEPSAINSNWNEEWTLPLRLPDVSVPFQYGPLSLDLTVTPSVNISWYVGWQFEWFQLKWFKAGMSIQASLDVKFEALASAILSKTWETCIFEGRARFHFTIGWLPVWGDLRFTINAVLDVEAYGEVSFVAETAINGAFSVDISWNRTHGWEWVEQGDLSTDCYVTLSAVAGISINSGIAFQLAFLFYGVAGPFVEFEPYVTADVTVVPEKTWNVMLGFSVDAGVTFKGWLRKVLNLEDWEQNLYNLTLGQWSDSWEEEPPPPPPPPEIHDLAIVSITPSSFLTLTDTIVDVNVTVRNNGEFDETFNASLYRNFSSIENHTDVVLSSGESKTLLFSWNTSGLLPNDYIIKAEVSTVMGEISLEDNVGNVTVQIIARILGDVTRDGSVNIIDLIVLARSFGSKLGDPNWNPDADINNDNIINILDAILIAGHFGKTS